MPIITFVSHDGTERTVQAQIGQSVMQAAMNNLVPGLIADCGGSCSCATCHAYIDAPWAERIPAPAPEERDMVDCALHLQDNSRLTCQVFMTPELDGLVVRTPVSQT
jgi:2Fe-2S ferredoxin